ncbi:hypothetical protein QYZ87_07890 [Porphyromonadaceae bacterium W3.11]|nr:hypothetical protein [Porphyromonadaceae bacterium W3.11]
MMKGAREVPHRAIDLMLERGVRFRLAAPLWQRWLQLDWVTIQPPKVGTVFLILREMMQYELDDLSLIVSEKPTEMQAEGVARVVAVAILGKEATDEEKMQNLTNRLNEVAWDSLLELYSIINQMLQIDSFRNTTASLGAIAMSLMRVKRKGS